MVQLPMHRITGKATDSFAIHTRRYPFRIVVLSAMRMGIFGFINSIIVSMCIGSVLSGTAIVMTATVSVPICTDADIYYICLHPVLLGVSYKVVSVFSVSDFIFSLPEIILSFIVLIITIFDLTFCHYSISELSATMPSKNWNCDFMRFR